ncbi:flagellar basal-body rod protein FlgC [Lachnospiraceae bacterium XBB1006]|nr:flagellar basal-body rod protein FlgC [Lachnospiraceae bacterium XBB1006]
MSVFQAFNINASGLTAQRFRTDIIAENIANVKTTRTQDGTPYRRQVVTFKERNITEFSHVLQGTREAAIGNGVKVDRLATDYESDFIMAYDPSHPDADENGYVSYPNVNIVTEMTDLIDASRSYEANATAFEASKSMMTTGLNMGKG